MAHPLIIQLIVFVSVLSNSVSCTSIHPVNFHSPARVANQRSDMQLFPPSHKEEAYLNETKADIPSRSYEDENLDVETQNISLQTLSSGRTVVNENGQPSDSHDAPNSRTLNWNLTLERFFPVDQWKAYGFFDEDYLTKINPHWLKFEPASPFSHLLLAFLYAIMMTVGCIGNFLVVFMFFRCRALRTPSNYLIANLAVSDFGMLLKTPIFIINSIYEGPVLGLIGCQIYGFVGGLTGITSIMTLATIAVDRYCVIVHPLNPYKKTTRSKAILMTIGVWVYSAIFSSIPLIALNGYVSEGYLTSCSFDYLQNDTKSKVFIFIFFLAAWFVPLCCIVFSYVAIFKMVAQAENMEFFTGENSRETFKYRKMQEKMRKDVKIAIVSTIIVLIWILAWTPYAIVALLGIFGQKQLITPFVSTLPALFCKISSCINPYIYSISHPKFQKELKNKCEQMFCCKNIDTLCTCSVRRSVSFGASISDSNTMCISKKIDCQRNDAVCFNVTLPVDEKASVTNDIQNKIDGLDTNAECKERKNKIVVTKYGETQVRNPLHQIRRSCSEPDISARVKISPLCSKSLNKLHSKF